MRRDAQVHPGPLARCGGTWMLPLLFAFLLSASGCAFLKENVLPKPDPEIVVQTAEYGTITQVTSALMKDREIRYGDIAITVDTEDGRVLVIVQPEDDIYRVGDRVRVIRDGQGFVRVQLQ